MLFEIFIEGKRKKKQSEVRELDEEVQNRIQDFEQFIYLFQKEKKRERERETSLSKR